MSKEKTKNFTDEQTFDLVTAYESAETQEQRNTVVEQFAEQFGKKKRSIVMKLVREGVYIKPPVVTKSGKPVMKKETIVQRIADLMGITADKIDSLEKANKQTLETLADTIADFRVN